MPGGATLVRVLPQEFGTCRELAHPGFVIAVGDEFFDMRAPVVIGNAIFTTENTESTEKKRREED